MLSCMKLNTPMERQEGDLPGWLQMTSSYSEYCVALLRPLAWHLLRLLGQLQGELTKGSWLCEGRTGLPLPFAKRRPKASWPGSEGCGLEVCGECVSLTGPRAHPPATPDGAACVTAVLSPTCIFLRRFKYVWLWMNVFKMYLNAIFPVSKMITQDSNTEFSRLFFQNITDFKICHSRDLGFVQMWEC